MASTPTGHGYWLVGADGGVFAFGDAAFEGSTVGVSLAAPIIGIVPTRDGGGYWLVGADGGVFAFGDAASTARRSSSSSRARSSAPPPPTAATATGCSAPTAACSPSATPTSTARNPTSAHPAVGIAAAPDGDGYWIAHADGSVRGFGTTVGRERRR